MRKKYARSSELQQPDIGERMSALALCISAGLLVGMIVAVAFMPLARSEDGAFRGATVQVMETAGPGPHK